MQCAAAGSWLQGNGQSTQLQTASRHPLITHEVNSEATPSILKINSGIEKKISECLKDRETSVTLKCLCVPICAHKHHLTVTYFLKITIKSSAA